MQNISRNLKGVKIARISTVVFFVDTQLHSQISKIVQSGAQVTVVASESCLGREIPGSSYFAVDIPRGVSLLRDFSALIKLYFLFHRSKFNIMHSTTPKAGLLSAIAGFFARIPIRVHTFTGQPWVSLSGPLGWVARNSDKVIGYLSTHCYADSESQREFLISSGIIKESKISVVGAGSLAGVNLSRFNPLRFSQAEKQELRAELGLDNECRVILFVGRICKDKGVCELLDAFEKTLASGVKVELLLVGPVDQGRDDGGSIFFSDLSSREKVHHVGYTNCPEKYMAIADLLCLPSYREGFGTVVIEAAAMGVPTLGTAIYGLTDAVVNGETGALIPPRDSESLANEMIRLVGSPELLTHMGKSAYARCLKYFDSDVVNKQVLEEYVRLMGRQ